MSLASSSIKLFLARSINAVVGFLGLTYFARELGPASMGVFFLFQAMVGLLATPTDMGLRGAVEKRISEGRSEGVFLSSGILLKLTPIALIGTGLLVFRPFVNEYIGAEIALLLALGLLLHEFAQLSKYVLRGELRVGETAIVELLKKSTWAVSGFVFIGWGLGPLGLIYAYLAGLSAVVIVGWYKTSVRPARPSVTHAKSLFEFGKYNAITSIGGVFYSWMDIAIIGLLLTQTAVGAYEVAWRVTAIVMLLSQSIALALFPQVSRWDTADAEERISSAIRETIAYSLLFVIPCFFGVIVFSREILGLVFGSEFTIAWLVLIVLMAEKLFQAIHVIISRALQGVDRPDIAAAVTVGTVGVNLVLNVVFILQFGLIGAALATLLSFGLNTVAHAHFLSKILTIELPYREISWCTLSAIMMTLALTGLQQVVSIDTLPRLLTAILFGGLVYGLLVLAFRPMRTKLMLQIKRELANL